MTYTKEALIKELGAESMAPNLQNNLLDLVYATLNMRVAMLLADKLTDEQLDQMNKLVQSNDDTAVKWLETTIPDQEAIVEAELVKVLAEIKQTSQSFKGTDKS